MRALEGRLARHRAKSHALRRNPKYILYLYLYLYLHENAFYSPEALPDIQRAPHVYICSLARRRRQFAIGAGISQQNPRARR